MYKRLISLENNKSFFLFGQRGTGKTTWLHQQFENRALFINLLDSKTYRTLSLAPWKLCELVLAKKKEQTIVIIDEIQKIPALLDEVHNLIEKHKIPFALTGSSARKLKRAGVNLLAGRAHNYKIYPLTAEEMGSDFNLDRTLQWGSLPQAVTELEPKQKEEYLYAYVDTYLREEIIMEQTVRQMEPFNRFLEVAAQSNGEIITFENIAKDTGVSAVTVKSYFQILVDTLIGFFLPAYHRSVRKRQKQASKFYFFDLGLARTLQNCVGLPPTPKSFEYGHLFECFLINEILRQNEYQRRRCLFSHLRIDNDKEIDLILEHPDKTVTLIEIKSRNHIQERDIHALNQLKPDFKTSKAICLSQDPERKKIDNVLCLPWQEGLSEIFSYW